MTLADEAEPSRPEMSRVKAPALFAGARKGLAGATPSPDRKLVWNASESQGIGPASDSGEEVAGAVWRRDFRDAALIDFPRW